MTRVWPGIFVEEVSLRVHIAALRKALEIGEAGPRYLTNVPGRGYCLGAPISRELIESVDPATPLSFEAAWRLPPRLARMVGRDHTVREICQKLMGQRFVTIVGPGGMGKTTVVLAVTHDLLREFRGAVCFVELGPLSDPQLVAATVASAFGLPITAESPVPSLIAHLRDKRLLLVLDCVEHLVGEAAVLTERLHGELPDLHILVTSREILRAEGENVHRLSALDSPPEDPELSAGEVLEFPAAKLLVERASTRGGPLTISDADAPIVGTICRKLGGMALAIELAAGRVGTYGLRETAAALDGEFALRWPGRRTAPPRHQTLSATLDWSYNLLSDAERKVLRRLSVFVNGFTLDGAQSVATAMDMSREEVFDAVAGLLAKSLASADTSGSVTRHRLLDTTRTYAAMKLADAGERPVFRRRHAEYYRELLQKMPGDAEAAANPHLDDIRAALNWGF